MLLLLAGLVIVSQKIVKFTASGKLKIEEVTVVVDCGHGGDDPGKVGVNGVPEKEINLKIGKLVQKKLVSRGIKVEMTREEDEMFAGEESQNKKIEDMKARVAFINETAPALTVSIHQNSYRDRDVRGAQVFYYSHSEEGKEAADIMQGALLALDAENKREEKANDSYYLLKRTEVPTIIVECGFLSNPQEAELLTGADYQEKVADAITEGVKMYLASKSIGK